MYPHINEVNPATRFYGKITGQSTRCTSLTDSAQVTVHQFNHFTTLPRTSEFMQVSPFSSLVGKDHFSWCTFLNVWKRLLFAGDGFAGARSINSAMLSVVHKTFSQMAPWFRSTYRLAASWKLLRNFFCFMSSQSTSKSKSAYFCPSRMCTVSKSGFGKIQHKSFRYSLEKWKGRVCCSCFMNDRIWNFWEAIRISGTPFWFWLFSGTNTVEP